ncbi:major facilitator superfamily domain-containing protein 6-like [Lytechinus variegatus]|uniref:major facilitator superfamily domain-containing protein 6-like n=1 Tax=Lytechinus variegatus TaxID=7654 RepID=UPI001BB0FA8E|nr:major facilitator superfamily domain-containing protein 6-like [Lytechinus variegatus]
MKLHINRALLPIKAVYFTHLAGLASLVPYLPLYMSQLGLSATQIGLIRGLEPLLALIFTHLWGSIADSFNTHRAVLITAIGGATVFLFGTFFVPSSMRIDAYDNITTQLPVNQDVPSFRTTDLLHPMDVTEFPPYLNEISPAVQLEDDSDARIGICYSVCRALNNSLSCEKNKGMVEDNSTSAIREESCLQTLCFLQQERANVNRTSGCNDSGEACDSVPHQSVSSCYQCEPVIYQKQTDDIRYNEADVWCSRSNENPLTNSTSFNISFVSYLNISDVTQHSFSCHCHEYEPDGSERDHSDSTFLSTFFLLLILILFSRTFQCTTSPILHSTTMELLQQKHDDFGKQRIWGAFGWGAFSLISGILIDHYARNSSKNLAHFDPAFYLFLAFMLAAVVFATFIVFPLQTSIKAQCQRIPRLIRKPEILGFLVTVCILGMGFGVIGTFLFLYLQELEASHTLMGLTLTITCIAEIPFLFLSNRVIRFTGHIGALCFSLFCYTVRFLGYSLISNPWAVIPFELLHGITYGLSWAACTSYANQNAPPGLALTLQAVFTSVHMGFGKGLGTLLGGLVYDRFGSRNLFRASAFVVGLSGLLYLGLYHVFTKRYPPILYSRFRTDERSSRADSQRESSSEGRVNQAIEMETAELEQLDDRPPKLDASSMRLALRDINRPASPPNTPSTSRECVGYQHIMEMHPHPTAYHHHHHQPPPPLPPPSRSSREMMIHMPCGYYHKRRMDSLEDDDGDVSPGSTSLAALIHSEQGREYGMERMMLQNLGVNMMSYLDDVDLDQAMDAV